MFYWILSIVYLFGVFVALVFIAQYNSQCEDFLEEVPASWAILSWILILPALVLGICSHLPNPFMWFYIRCLNSFRKK